MEEKSTGRLMSELMGSESFDGYIKANSEFLKAQSVSDYINQMIAYKGLTRSGVAKASGLNVIHAYVWEKCQGTLDMNEALFQHGEKTLC